MIDLSLLSKILILLIDTIGIWLGVWVYLSDKKAKTNQLFTSMIVFALLWINLCYLSGILTNNLDLSLFLGRLAYGVAILFFVPFYYFSKEFIGSDRKFFYLDVFIPIVSLLVFFLSVFTDFMAQYMTPVRIGVAPVIGKGKFVYFGLVFFVALFVITRLFIKYFKSSKREKLRLQYFFTGIFIFVISNLVFNVILAFWEGIARYYQIGNYSIILLLAFTAYAIVKQELFGIKVVITAIFVILIGLLLAIDALFFTPNPILQLFKGGILIVFAYFGYLLIKSVITEIERRQEVEKLSRAKSEFISIASHQLRTPLTVIKGYVSMVLEGGYGKMPPKMIKPMKNVYEADERLIRLVNDLLNLSRIEAGKIGFEPEEVNVEKLISTTVDILHIEAESKKIYLKFKKPKEIIPKIWADPGKLKEVVTNLIDNCIKYTDKGGVIVKLQKARDNMRIIIKDTGAGMTKAEIAKLFQSFSRGTAGTRSHTQGTGLGLYVSKRFIEMHNGKVWVESDGEGKGSTFYIELPIKRNNHYKA